MADQTFSVNSGFYDAVNNDRTYSADDMNRPYKRIVGNGVFPTTQGNPSTDLLVESAGTGMQVIVNAGEGIFADKWFENPSIITITVPNNTDIVPRIDSVIIQIDQRQSGRVGNIVYRTGTPASTPSVPEINQVANVTEYRLANISVAASATTISNDAITDLRGTTSCPWVTSLVQQDVASALVNYAKLCGNQVIPDNSNFNSYTTVGTYYVQNTSHAQTMTNPPFDDSGFMMYVMRPLDNLESYKLQFAMTWRGLIKTRYTSNSGSTWSEWTELSGSANITYGTAPPSGGSDGDIYFKLYV